MLAMGIHCYEAIRVVGINPIANSTSRDSVGEVSRLSVGFKRGKDIVNIEVLRSTVFQRDADESLHQLKALFGRQDVGKVFAKIGPVRNLCGNGAMLKGGLSLCLCHQGGVKADRALLFHLFCAGNPVALAPGGIARRPEGD